eukprot:TRINITY_DN28024_c0_g1_i1.p2 TRINITY_DN28024_c0_g1~~TRINITY_DN28024_c0_g1_i1.p2  ORF type:complete len:242 (+),score=79.64 TRINITY_DN28024_c0_g1_i1:104-727(+)
MATLTNPKFNRSGFHNAAPTVPWFQHGTDMTLPGPGASDPKEPQWVPEKALTGPRWARTHRSHPVDNLKLRGVTGVETPGPGAHNPEQPAAKLHSVKMQPPVVPSKHARLQPITPGPSCYAPGVDATHRVAPKGFLPRAGRKDLWNLPAPGEVSCGPPAVDMVELLKAKKRRQRRPVWSTPLPTMQEAGGTFSRETRFNAKVGTLRC